MLNCYSLANCTAHFGLGGCFRLSPETTPNRADLTASSWCVVYSPFLPATCCVCLTQHLLWFSVFSVAGFSFFFSPQHGHTTAAAVSWLSIYVISSPQGLPGFVTLPPPPPPPSSAVPVCTSSSWQAGSVSTFVALQLTSLPAYFCLWLPGCMFLTRLHVLDEVLSF